MEWFSSISETVQKATEAVSEQVQNAIPLDKDLIAKLTLNTDEMKAERDNFNEEAKRKAAAKDILAGMLPWETKDPERDILVDECKEAILALSSKKETFFGPFQMVALEVDVDEATKDTEGNEEEDEEEEELKRKKFLPSEESIAKLAKLEPLPPLLQEFDLDSHVGLIERMLIEDPHLVKMQSELSGGGPREETFWRNYFFNCAFTRYEAGLSIDEIWSFQTESPQPVEEIVPPVEEEGDEEDAIVLDNVAENEAQSVPAFQSDEAEGKVTVTNSPENSMQPDSVANESYEFLDEGADIGDIDPELDELEAEILRELED